MAPLCFEASVNLAGFLAAAVIRDLARINRSYKSLFLSRFPRIGAWLVAEETRSNGRRKCFPLPESEERIETCDYSVASSAETKGPCDERTSVGRFIYIYIHDDWFVIRNNKGSDKFLAGIGFAWYKRFDLSTIANNRPRTLDRLFRLFLVTLLISFKFVLDVIAPWNYVFRSRSFYILIPPGFTLTILFTIFEKVYIFPFKFA